MFKKEPTPREVARSTQRDLGRNVRDVEREIAALRREEQKLIKVGGQRGGMWGSHWHAFL